MRGTFRLSVVAAVIAAAFMTWKDWRSSVEQHQSQQELLRVIECGARVPEEQLKRAVNESGNIDLSRVGCSEEQFFASFQELNESRSGALGKQAWLSSGPSINVTNMIAAAIGALIAVNVLGLVFLSLRAVVRWVSEGFTRT